MKNALVSTIIPVHNRPLLLREAVESVLTQSYRPIEIIIVDDGSSDETPQVINALAAAHPDIVHSLRIDNGGPGAAREAGRQRAKGAFIQYLDSDDLLLPEKFSQQVAGLLEHPDCDISYCVTMYRTAGCPGEPVPWKRTGERIETLFPSMLTSRWWGTSTPLYRRIVIDHAGPWLSLRTEEDWEYDCRIARYGARLHYVPHFLSLERDHSGERLSRDGSTDPSKLADRAVAQLRIFEHAQTAGIASESDEMRRFARATFLLARQCGARGLADEASSLFDLSRRASTPERARALDFRLYSALVKVTGWRTAGCLSKMLDKLRNMTRLNF